MSIRDTLDKIVSRHPDVIGALVSVNGQVHHNLESPYDMISADSIMETFTEIFEQTSMLADEGYDFGEMMLDFETHSFIIRVIDNGLLVVLAPRLQRGQLVKLHVGLGLFGKAVQKAIEEEAAANNVEPEAPAEPQAPVEEAPTPVFTSAEPRVTPRVLSEPIPEPEDIPTPSGLGSRPGSGNRTNVIAEMIARRRERTTVEPVDATSEPVSKQENEDGVPLNADGTPKKKKFYRGQEYWE